MASEEMSFENVQGTYGPNMNAFGWVVGWDILHSSCFNVKLWRNSTNGMKLQTDEWTYERKDKNYIFLGINGGEGQYV